MDKAKTAEAYGTLPIPEQIGNGYAPLVTYNNSLDGTSSPDKNADLTSCFIGDFGEKACELRMNDLLRRDFSSVDMLDFPDLAGL